jgi:hypothetical protein
LDFVAWPNKFRDTGKFFSGESTVYTDMTEMGFVVQMEILAVY